MSFVSRMYSFALATRGSSTLRRRVGSHPAKKLPDSAVLELRREYEATHKRDERMAVIRRYAAMYGSTYDSVRAIANYQSRSNPDRPLDPSIA
jgi:hypothetical protein